MEYSDYSNSPEDLNLILKCLHNLCLNDLDLNWVESIWDSQFTEFEELPLTYELINDHEHMSLTLRETAQNIRKWVENNAKRASISSSMNESVSSSVSSIWTIMVSQNIQIKSLIALLFYLMSKGQKLNGSLAERHLCTQSASLYFLLLSLPGSGAFKVFDAVLYSKTLNTFKLASKLQLVRLSSNKKHQGKKKSSQAIDLLNDSDASDDESNDLLTPEQMGSLTKALNSVLNNFLFHLHHFSLKRSQETLESAIAELVDLTHLDFSSSLGGLSSPRKQAGVSSLASNAYKGLQDLCSRLHGGSTKVCKMIFKALLPGVLMIPRSGSEMSPKGLTAIREHSLNFLDNLINMIGEESHEAVEIFIQHLAYHVPDKAEFRQKASLSIASITRNLPRRVYNRIVKWFLSWSYNESVSQRLFAVEVMGIFILEKERPVASALIRQDDCDPNDNSIFQDLISHKFIFAVLLDRCRDVSPKVRAKAFKTLSDITLEAHDEMVEIIRSTFNEKRSEEADPSRTNKNLNFIEILRDSTDADLQVMDPLPCAEDIIEFLILSVSDESVFVRKSSLQVMFNIVQISDHLREELVRILARHCRDPSLMVRKQMVGSLTEILKRYDDNQTVIHLWVEGVFPIVLDSESKASEKALECIWEMVFSNLTNHNGIRSERNILPWRIIHESENLGMTKYLTRASGIWHKEGLLKPNVFKMIRSHINTENNDRAWFLLAVITNHVPLQNPHFVMEYFNSSIHTHKGVGLYTLLQVLSVLLSSVSRLSSQDQKTLQKDLVLLIERFSLPPELISMAMDIATVVSQLEALRGDGSIDANKYHLNIESWACNVVNIIENDLDNVQLAEDSSSNDPRVIRQMFTLGELALILPKKIKKKHFLFFQNLAFDENAKKSSSSSKISALAIVTLNKMCVTNEEMAKTIVPAYGRLLDESTDPAVKNNIIYGLSDLCVKYANVVESLVPQMTTCLKDKSSLVKRTTLVTIIHLLQEDYLKIGGGRGSFFLRLVQTLLDEEVKSLTEFFIKHRLLKKSPNVMYQHFIEALFFFNEYVGHPTYNKFIDSSQVQKMFSIAGESGKSSRMFLYKFMLENMNDEQRFQMTYKLCQDVLGGTVEGHIKINNESQDLLKDVLACLASDEIKLVSLRAKSSGDEGEETESSDLAGAVAAVAKKTIISQVVKKNIIENIVPIVIALKHKLEELKNTLIDDLMTYLREIMKDYKNEVKEIISADKRLAHEIQFDLKRWEDQQRREEEDKEGSRTHLEEGVDGPSNEKIISREVKEDRLIRQALKSAIVNFRSRRRTLNDGTERVNEEEVASRCRRTLTHIDLLDGRNESRNARREDPKESSEDETNDSLPIPTPVGENENIVEPLNSSNPPQSEKPLQQVEMGLSPSEQSSIQQEAVTEEFRTGTKRPFHVLNDAGSNSSVAFCTPAKRKKCGLPYRAISTPAVGVKNISFMNDTFLSNISVISAPTPKKGNSMKDKENEDDEDTIGSFKFRKNQKNDFDNVFSK